MRMSRFLLFFTWLAAPAFAQSPIAEVICEAKHVMSDRLTRQMGARQMATGLRAPEELMELWVSETGDWSLVMTHASGSSCIVAMGEHFAPTGADVTGKVRY